jgi:cardiolipin synthase A/B
VPASLRLLADQAFSRAAGAPLVEGNRVKLLRDARENYPAWLDAIAGAERWIHFEMYMVNQDRTGRQFAEALAERARAGVRVRLLYDWVGSLPMVLARRYWKLLLDAGVEARPFNPPRFDSPFTWMARDHRKVITVDGHTAFVTGLCVGDQWAGDPARGIEPWRDTGIGIVGPAVADVEAAFAEAWQATGPPLPADEMVGPGQTVTAGDVALRVIPTMPGEGGMLRVDQLVAALARKTLWVTDAYFVGVPAYVEALRGASADGVDVRLLVPGSGSDIAAVQRLTRAGYRQLLEGGVRVFEWNGAMMHAKTAVADARWARVGSTNLNLQSWLGNWELDVAVEDEGFGAEMHAMYEADLANSTEIVLHHRRVESATPPPRKARGPGRYGRSSRAAAGALRIGKGFGAALTSTRPIGASEAITLLYAALFALTTAGVSAMWPQIIAVPLGILGAWLGVAWAARAWRLHRDHGRHGEDTD